MNEPRLKYAQLAPEGMTRMRDFEHYLNTAAELPSSLQGLVRLLASLMNGCEYCIHLHTAELRKLNETDGRIAELREWREGDRYTEQEKAALGWTEALTNIQDGHAPDASYDAVRAHFSDVEIVNLTLTIVSINAWNRLAIALGTRPGHG